MARKRKRKPATREPASKSECVWCEHAVALDGRQQTIRYGGQPRQVHPTCARQMEVWIRDTRQSSTPCSSASDPSAT